MATVNGKPEVTIKIFMELSEDEARALEAIMSYGADSFLKIFYQHMGESYLKPHETGLRKLFETARPQIAFLLNAAKTARTDLNSKNTKKDNLT